jgi:ubiquinone/menaquinone biosynthesis C-methylase UbiE
MGPADAGPSRDGRRPFAPRDAGGAKDAEKTYLSRAGSEAWERTKPFAPPGHDMLPQGLPLIFDFAVAVTFLEIGPGERVLDLGAGPCWVSEWLQRLNVETVSVDISVDMLRVGRGRLPRKPLVVAGDLEHLPIRSGAFDKALCLNAFHHVTDMPRGLAEICRVLRPGGRIVFSEPGRGHAGASTSTRATDEFGVTEQDIVVSDFLDACRAAGFSRARIKPMSYVMPHFEMTAEQWQAWERLARSKRPLRALRKVWLGLLEVVGAGKSGGLVEEALARDLGRLLHDAVADHPVVVATK